ncbi:MAG: energy transducer TonB [Terriglobales bacterium]
MSDNFQLGLLPERKMDWRALVSSYGLITFLFLFSLFGRLVWPDQMPLLQRFTVTEIIPRPPLRPEAVKRPRLRRTIVAKLPPIEIETPKLILPKIVRLQPKPVPKEIEPPRLDARIAAPVLVRVSAARPAKLLYTGSFGSSAVATLNTTAEKVQTGGFGDPNGLKGEGKGPSHMVAATMGSFDLPQGAGHGNGSGGAKGLQGTIASAGFGNGIARPSHGDGRASGAVAQTGFTAQAIAAPVTRTVSDQGSATSPIEITYKPKPVYTEEARKLQLQGEVLLEVTFAANGQLHVNRVVRGLGHGLDEAAVVATNNMRFKPAKRNGSPVDLTAVVHVMFELAM